MSTARLLDTSHLPNSPEALEQDRTRPVEECCTKCGSQDIQRRIVPVHESGFRCEQQDGHYLECEDCGECWNP